MGYFVLIFGFLFTFIATIIKVNKTYIPKTDCSTDIKDAKSNLIHMRTFFILGPSLIVISIILIILGVGL